MTKCIPILPGILHQGRSPEEKSYLIGSRCKECGRTFFPKRYVCNACMKDETMEETPLSTRGKIDTFSVVQVAPLGFEAPYIQAFVDLPEGLRVFSIITGCSPSEESLKEGDEVELVIEKIAEDENGNDLIGYKFRPFGGEQRPEKKMQAEVKS
jgi:uncharacterized OB-fold protein